MSLLTGPRREKRADRPTSNLAELIRRREPALDGAGVQVTVDTATHHSAVFSCVDLIARMLSTFPVHEFRRRPGGVLHRLPDQPRILDTPDGNLDFTAWAYQVIDSLLKTGNAFGLIHQLGPDGWPTNIETMPPAAMSYTRKSRHGPLQWRLDGTPISVFPAGELWHMPAYVTAGSPVGMSPIAYAAVYISLGLAAQRFGARWFRDGAVPTAVLSNDNEVSKAAAELVKERWLDALNSNREPVVLGQGWQHDLVTVNPEESQFLETIQANVVDICRFFGVDPTDIGAAVEGSSITYQNVEMRNLNLLTRTLGPWMVRLERALGRLRPGPRVVKFNADALLRVDTATRHRAHDTAIRGGWLSVDEVRALEDRPPLTDRAGDQHLWPPYRSQLTQAELNNPGLVDQPDVAANGTRGGPR